MRTIMKKRVIWLFLLIVISYAIFFITYTFFVSKMNLHDGEEVTSYLRDAIMMQVTYGGIISVIVLIAGAFLIDWIVNKNSKFD